MEINIDRDLGREYSDPPHAEPRVQLRPLPPTPWTARPTEFIITRDGKTYREPVWYAHLGLLKLIKHFDFQTVLDLGTNDGRIANVFEYLGKDVIALEPNTHYLGSTEYPHRDPDIEYDYFDTRFIKRFDAIWCSHVLEHVRNPGAFLDKIYEDLREDGVLAVTVPFNDGGLGHTSLMIGHHNKYNHWLVLYQLVCAGFDCRKASVAVYNGQITVIVQKVPNNLPRSTAALCAPFPPGSMPSGVRRLSRDGKFNEPRIYEYFPFKWESGVYDNSQLFVNWGNPI